MSEAKYRNALPQLNGKPCIADGGLETCLIFHDGFDLPLFAAFPLLNDEAGRTALHRYMGHYADIAIRHEKGLVMDTPTWRASPRWADELGVSKTDLRDAHAKAVGALIALRGERETAASPFIVNGAIGPHDDGYNPQSFLSVADAKAYHSDQIGWFVEFGADMVSAITMTYAQEATGLALAAKDAGMPCIISFTVETDGRLPSGQALSEAIEEVDGASDASPAYYMLNCAHPDHFDGVLQDGGDWRGRIMGLRANASRMSHAELDAAEELDEGNPAELGAQYQALMAVLPNLAVVGGCCGTDHRHIEAISSACGDMRVG